MESEQQERSDLETNDKVLSRATNRSDFLSFLKDRNWGSPGDRRRNPHWDLLRAHQREDQSRGMEHSETVSKVEREEPRVQREDEETEGEVMTSSAPHTGVTVTDGEEMSKEEERGDLIDMEGRSMSSLSEEEKRRTSTDEETQEIPCDSEEEAESVDGDEE